MKKIFLLVFILVTLLSAKSLIPFSKGSFWEYTIIKNGKTHKLKINITEEKNINGITWYLNKSGDFIEWYANTNIGVVLANNIQNKKDISSKKIDKELFLKFPASVGQNWSFTGMKMTYKGMEDISVPAGNFKCHKYLKEAPLSHLKELIYVSQKAGIVFIESEFEGKKSLIKLTKYKIEK